VRIDFFKGILPVKALLEKLIAEDNVFTAGPILFELLQGIRSPEEREQVKEAFMATHYLEIKPDDWGALPPWPVVFVPGVSPSP
jgi:predicted nucleic acid-binding protein